MAKSKLTTKQTLEELQKSLQKLGFYAISEGYAPESASVELHNGRLKLDITIQVKGKRAEDLHKVF